MEETKDWAVSGECKYCGHHTCPDNLLTNKYGTFCDDECLASWKKENLKV